MAGARTHYVEIIGPAMLMQRLEIGTSQLDKMEAEGLPVYGIGAGYARFYDWAEVVAFIKARPRRAKGGSSNRAVAA